MTQFFDNFHFTWTLKSIAKRQKELESYCKWVKETQKCGECQIKDSGLRPSVL